MKSSQFEKLVRKGNYRQVGMFPVIGGQAYLAEKIVHTPQGVHFETLWAAGSNADNLEIAQKITFNYQSTKHMREKHALQLATEHIALRDYSGDPGRG